MSKEYATIIYNNGLHVPDPVAIPDWSRPYAYILNGLNLKLDLYDKNNLQIN